MGAVGLCGDMNGERSADLKTPPMCVLRPRLAAMGFMLNKSGAQAGFERCSGLPAALKEEFVRESTKCPREVIIPTPVSKLYEHISGLSIPTGMKHIVTSKPTSFAFPSRWSRPACPSQSPSRRSLLSLPASSSHLLRPAPLRSVPCLASLSSRRSLSSQLFSARKSWRQLPAALIFPLVDMVITSGIVMTANILLFG